MVETIHYNAGEAAKKVGRAYSTIREHIRQGSLHAERQGRELVIEESELRRLYPKAFADTADGSAGDIAGGETESADGGRSEGADGLDDSDGGHTAESVDSADGETDSADGVGGVVETAKRDVGTDPFGVEVEVLRAKLEVLEREHNTTQDALMDARDQVLHLRGMTTQQGETIQNLAEEIKGLTITLHNEQGQRMQLQSNLDEVKSERRGLFGRMFRRKKIARVGPK